MKSGIFIIVFCCQFFTNGFSQNLNSDIVNKKWKAFWISVPGEPANQYGVYNFRKNIELSSKPNSFLINVSADNRYKLYVNGNLVSLGPARGDLFHWNFETVDIANFLSVGKNVITAIVWNFGDHKPEAQISLRTAFILQGNSDKENIINTNKTWKCITDTSYEALPPNLIYSYYVSGPGEKIDYNKRDDAWKTSTYDDISWKEARELFNGVPKGVFDWSTGWMLVSRSIKSMELTPQRLNTVRKVEGLVIPEKFASTKTSVTIPANKKIKILLDQNFLTNAYPNLDFSKGKDAVITLSYAEALYIDEKLPDWKNLKQKGNRNDIDGKRFIGVSDQIISNGKNDQNFTSLWWRTYRYMQLEVETKNEALVINDIYGTFTGYPFVMKAEFKTKNNELKKIMEVGWRTARLCAVETYMDCPYYEQLQYLGDTRIQALVSLFNGGDESLMRNAINQLDYSRMAEGITLSRYPSANAQEIPTFALWWIAMLHDYWMYRPDSEFVKSKLPGLRQVLTFFKTYQQNDGSLKNAPYWEFTDWANGPGWKDGVPPIAKDGTSSTLDVQLCLAYQLAAELEENLGMKDYARQYLSASELLQQTITAKYWDSKNHRFADTSEKITSSHHINTLAILTGTIKGEEARKLMQTILSDKSLTPATIYFKYYVHRALAKVGMGDQYLNLLNDWKDQLSNGLTTWAEISDHNNARSDCHAWGASPNIEFFRIVLGIDSDAPGFSKIKIEPYLGALDQASGKMPHPNGEISVDYTSAKGKWKAEIILPPNTAGRLVWKGKEFILKAGEKNIINL